MAQDDEKKVAPESGENPTEQVNEAQNGAATSGSDTTKDPAEAVVEEAEKVVAEVEEEPSEDEIAIAKAEAAAMKDKYLRLQAEWDNFRKRTAEQAEDQRVRATERLMGDILPVLDDFERAIAHADTNGEQGLLDGVKAISTKLGNVLEKHGLVTIDPAGEAFDALQHQAVSTVEDTTVPDETVAQVYQKGYRLGVKVIRPAMVVISSGGPKREKPEEDN